MVNEPQLSQPNKSPLIRFKLFFQRSDPFVVRVLLGGILGRGPYLSLSRIDGSPQRKLGSTEEKDPLPQIPPKPKILPIRNPPKKSSSEGVASLVKGLNLSKGALLGLRKCGSLGKVNHGLFNPTKPLT